MCSCVRWITFWNRLSTTWTTFMVQKVRRSRRIFFSHFQRSIHPHTSHKWLKNFQINFLQTVNVWTLKWQRPCIIWSKLRYLVKGEWSSCQSSKHQRNFSCVWYLKACRITTSYRLDCFCTFSLPLRIRNILKIYEKIQNVIVFGNVMAKFFL